MAYFVNLDKDVQIKILEIANSMAGMTDGTIKERSNKIDIIMKSLIESAYTDVKEHN